MHQNAGAFGPALGGAGFGAGGGAWGGGGTTVNETTTVNNYYGNDPRSDTIPADDQQGADPGYQQDADTTDYASDSGDSGDFGGGSDDSV